MEGNRKLLAAAAALVVGVGATLIKGDMPPGLVTLVQFVFGAFIAGNGVEHVSAAVAARAEPTTPSITVEGPTQADLDAALEAALAKQQEGHQQLVSAVTLVQQAESAILEKLNFIINAVGLNKPRPGA